ncbi:hypothetical protein D3C81_1739850 [compost metagenome]
MGSVFEVHQVADCVVAVFQVLQWRSVGLVCADANEATVRRIVAVAGNDAVAGGFRLDLAGGVVVKIAHQRLLTLVITGQGEAGDFQLGSDGVGEALKVAQRIDLPEQLAARGIS